MAIRLLVLLIDFNAILSRLVASCSVGDAMDQVVGIFAFTTPMDG